MKLLRMKKVRDGRYLKDYELTYENKIGKEKVYEIVSLKELSGPESLGAAVTGVSIAAVYDGKLLLLKEFRMALIGRFMACVQGIWKKTKPWKIVSGENYTRKRGWI